MTTSDPDQLRREIERTQYRLGDDVNRLTEKVTPSRIVQRRVSRVRRSLSGMRERVMGTDYGPGGTPSARHRLGEATSSVTDRASSTASDVADRASTMASSAAERVSDVASSAAEAARQTPDAVRRGTEGNPLAAGLIAFAAGWLVSSLAPPTRAEQQLAEQAEGFVRDHAEPVKERAQQVATEVKENLREPAQQAAESVRTTASDAASTVTDEARGAATDVQSRAQDARDNVRDQT